MAEFGLDERVARLEGRVEGFSERFDGIDHRLDRMDGRMEHFEHRLDSLDAKMDRGFESLDQKISRHFIWTVGIQVAVLLAVVTALTGR